MFTAAALHSLVNFSAVKIDITDIFIFAGIILAAICAIWGIRKMFMLGYISSIPGHWQKKYDKEKDIADYKEFRDEGGFERGSFSFGLGGRAYRFDGFSSDSEDDFKDEYIGSVGDKSWYYDSEGNVYSLNNDDPPTGWYDENDVLHIYEGHEDEYNEWLECISFESSLYSKWDGDPDEADEEEDLNIGWDK